MAETGAFVSSAPYVNDFNNILGRDDVTKLCKEHNFQKTTLKKYASGKLEFISKNTLDRINYIFGTNLTCIGPFYTKGSMRHFHDKERQGLAKAADEAEVPKERFGELAQYKNIDEEEKRLAELIADYCKDDVLATEEAYKKIRETCGDLIFGDRLEEVALSIKTKRIDDAFVDNVLHRTHKAPEYICEAIGLAPDYFTRDRAGADPIPLYVAKKVAEYCDMTVDELLVDHSLDKKKKELEDLKAKVAVLEKELEDSQ